MNVCGGNSSSVEMRQRKEEWVDRRGQRDKRFSAPRALQNDKKEAAIDGHVDSKERSFDPCSSSFSSIMLQLPSHS